MPSWKKIIVSGSDASLNSLYAPSITGSLQGTASYAIYAETSSFSYRTTQTDILVLNQSGNTIEKGVVVRITGSNNASDIPRIVTASYENDGVSANTLGITTQQITNGSQGYIITEGVLTGINTSNFTSGQLLFLGATGSIINYAPVPPLHGVRLGQVIREQQNNGSMHVRIDNGYELEELHNVITANESFGDLLINSGSVWVNSKQLTGSYGLTGSLQIAGSTSTDLVRITQTGTGNAFVVEDEANPDTTPFVINQYGSVGIGTTTPSAKLHVDGNTLITGSLTIGTSSIGANENTLVLGPAPAGGSGEGAQLLLQASGGLYTSASMIDNYQNKLRILRGTNQGSDAYKLQLDMHTGQMQLPNYNSGTAFSGTAAGYLAFDSSGNIITTVGVAAGAAGSDTEVQYNSGGALTGTTALRIVNSSIQMSGSVGVTGSLTATNSIIAQANGAMYLRGGDDAELWDINVANTVGIYGQQDQGIASIKLGSGGGTISGRSGSIGIGLINPVASLHVRTTAVPSTGETIAQFDVSDDSSYLRISNGTGANSTFIPSLESYNTSNQTALYTLGNGATDTGTEPLLTYDARIGAAQVVTRPLFQWSNYGNTKMTMLANGNLGIGIATPSASLHVNNTSTSASFLIEDSTNPDTTPFVIDNQGRVGIGTINPAAKLQVDGDSYVNGGHYIYHPINSTSGHLNLDHSGVQMWKIGIFNDNTSTFSIGNGAGNTFGDRVFNLTTGGNLGLGTNTPNAKLDVQTSISNVESHVASIVNNYNNITNPTIAYPILNLRRTGVDSTTYSSAANFGISRWENVGTNSRSQLNISLAHGNSSTPDIDVLTLRSNGNVGIGITSPTNLLHISKTADSYLLDGLKVDRDPTVSSSAIFNAYGGSANIISNSGTTSVFPSILFGTSDNTTVNELMRITTVGLGIGTGAPNAKLDVNGDAIITGSLTITNNLIVQGSSSIQYITSSQLNIGDNIISVNTINPTFRFGGISVIDSGSSPQTSGSLLFDSQNNQWIFVHQNTPGSAVTSSVLIMGPQTFNDVGNETTITANRLTKGFAGDLGEHIGDSNITDTGTLVSINSNTEITGSLTIIQTGSANAFVVYDSNSDSSPFVIDSSGSVGIGYSTPSSVSTKLYVSPDISGFIGIWATGFNNHGIKGTSTTDNKSGIYGEHATDALVTGIGVHGRATYSDTPFNGQQWIGGKFEAAGDSLVGKNYSVQLKDGTEAAGKVLVSQDASGSANWSTRLSGSYEITGSLTVTGNLGGSGGSIDMNAMIQASLLYLSNNF